MMVYSLNRFANHKAPCTAISQQPLQSVLALRGCSATDLLFIIPLILHLILVLKTFLGDSTIS